jgi:hypothetical protein
VLVEGSGGSRVIGIRVIGRERGREGVMREGERERGCESISVNHSSRPREVSIQQVSIHHCLPEHPPSELEVVQVVLVDAAQGVGLEGGSVLAPGEEAVVGVEDLARQDHVPEREGGREGDECEAGESYIT